jgi:hypothetical protein
MSLDVRAQRSPPGLAAFGDGRRRRSAAIVLGERTIR